MYVIAKECKKVETMYGQPIKLDLSNVWKVVQTAACKSGEYALFQKSDKDIGSKFSIFRGYVSYEDICNWFELIKWQKGVNS